MSRRLIAFSISLGIGAIVALSVLCTPRPAYTYQTCDTGDPQCDLRQGGGDDNVGPCSPIIIDVRRTGYDLTSARDGVVFDIIGSGKPVAIAWTSAGSGNGFLALDRNHNGTIDNGTELFGDVTPQPSSKTPNGFLALSEFDTPEYGGNLDGVIDASDAVFGSLQVWIDDNHDGVSQTRELHTLSELGIISISVEYKSSGRVDQYGNRFLYRAKVTFASNTGSAPGQELAYDVFLTSLGS